MSGSNHYGFVFTKFFQAHILPIEFGDAKRRIHLSDLMNNEIRRDEALRELEQPPYDPVQPKDDPRAYLCKKLGFSEAEFAAYQPPPDVARALGRGVSCHSLA